MNVLEALGATIRHDVEGWLGFFVSVRPLPPRLQPLPGDDALHSGRARAGGQTRRETTAPELSIPQADPTVPAGLPVAGIIASRFGMREHPTLEIPCFHHGIDIAAPIGTPVIATAAGNVEFAGAMGGAYGNTVVVRHRKGIKTRYAHLHSIGVDVNQTVARGQQLGTVGTAGSGPHLHYEVLVENRYQDPGLFLP